MRQPLPAGTGSFSLGTQARRSAFATQGSIPYIDMQPPVAIATGRKATVSSMESKDYWRNVCAPVVRSKKKEIGRAVTNTDIAAAVERATGKDTSRQLVEHWFRGLREPYMSQFVALCDRLGIEPVAVLTGGSVKNVTPKAAVSTLLYNSKHGHRASSDEKKRRKTQG